jgi:histidyl-tRNA synthetase
MSQRKINGPSSGFPELLPELRRVEQQWMDLIRLVFETYGFASLETAAVEELNTIIAKGEDTDKEIYGLRRLKEVSTVAQFNTLGLHFDLTVPLARYVAQNYHYLTFPFKRYQIQKVWRGERPQEGRYREFAQCDIDVVDNENVALQFDIEMPRMIHKIFDMLGIEDIQTNINNRKIIQGYYEGIGIKHTIQAIRIVDKLDKLGKDAVAEMLQSQIGLNAETAHKCLRLAEIKTTDTSFANKIAALGVTSDLMSQGIEELTFVMKSLSNLPQGSVAANMAIARGLDYYTGTVYEGKFTSYPEFPTIYAGGHYENLLSSYSNKKLPGVGISIGLTRTLLKLHKENRIQLAEKCPTDVVVINMPNNDYEKLSAKAEMLRSNGINVEIFHDSKKKTGEQIKYAGKKGIKYALFIRDKSDEIKNLVSGEQQVVDIDTWTPDRSDSLQTHIIPSRKKSVLGPT